MSEYLFKRIDEATAASSGSVALSAKTDNAIDIVASELANHSSPEKALRAAMLALFSRTTGKVELDLPALKDLYRKIGKDIKDEFDSYETGDKNA